jgi:hypothetical protein
MADSLSFGGALPVAAIAACCESFQLSLLAMTFPLASRNESVGFASGVVTPALASDGPSARTRTRSKLVPFPRMMVPPISTSLPVPTKARAQVRRLRVCPWINIVNFRPPDAGGHCLSLEEESVSPGRKSNQGRSVEIIRRGQSRRLNLRLLRLFPIVVSRDERAGVIEQIKGRIGQRSRNAKGSQ